MSLISGHDYIDPNINYSFSSDFYIDDQSESVFVMDESNDTSVIDFNKIPFKSGTITVLSEQSGGGLGQVEIDGKIYNVMREMPFNKGSYFGRQYELARKVAFINQNLRQGELKYCPGVQFTHEGNAIVPIEGRRPLAALDIPAIEMAYTETLRRLHSRPSLQLAELEMPLLNPAVHNINQPRNFFGVGYKGVVLAGLAFGLALGVTEVALRALIMDRFGGGSL